MAAAFEAISLSKTYKRWWSRRAVHALNGVSFSVEPGSIFGLRRVALRRSDFEIEGLAINRRSLESVFIERVSS